MAASHLPTPALPPASPPAGPDIPALQAKTAGAGTIGEVLKLASVAAESQRREAQLFRERLSRDPSAWRDRAALAELRKLVADPNTAPAALAAAAELPGPAGADILYEIWTATPNRTATTELARALLHSKDVRAKASEALSIALELRLAETCAANRELLPRAQQVGDRRAFSVLSKLSRRQGCGPNKQQDCYACLRDGMDLEEATKATKARRAPSPFTPP